MNNQELFEKSKRLSERLKQVTEDIKLHQGIAQRYIDEKEALENELRVIEDQLGLESIVQSPKDA